MLTIGILHEGEYDYRPMRILVEKILEDKLDISLINFIPYPANGPIINKLEAASTRFFEPPIHGEQIADFAIYHSDVDNDKTKKPTLINWIKDHTRFYSNRKIIPMFADPHFEEFFFAENDAVKSYFNFSQKIPVDKSLVTPKNRIKKLINTYISDISIEVVDVYCAICKKINIKNLIAKDKNFKAFNNNLLEILNSVNNKC